MKCDGKLNVSTGERARINWVIAGGETGKNARPMHPEWARGLRDQCAESGTHFFLKQIEQAGRIVHAPFLDGRQWLNFPEVTP
jgi:protein gp37